MNRNWTALGILINITIFVILTHIAFALDPPKIPYPPDVYMMWIAWGLSAINLMFQATNKCWQLRGKT